jgi:cytochrome c peroxidase
MSGLLTKRAWVSGVALVSVFAFAACSDDDDNTNTSTAGKSGGGSSGSSSGGKSAGGTSSGGKGGDAAAGKGGNTTAGTAGTSTAGTSAGGQNLGGEGGVGGLGGAAGAGGEGGAPDPLAELRKQFKGMSPLPAVPADTTNKYADNADAATLGQKLFFDKNFSGALTADGGLDLGAAGDAAKVSCASCHSGGQLIDQRNLVNGVPEGVALGTGKHTRNAPGVVNSVFYTWTNWGGRFAAPWELPLVVVENGAIMGFNRLALAHRLYGKYKTEYEAAFGAFPADISDTNRFPAAGKPKPAPSAANPTPADGLWETAMTPGDRTIVNGILVNYSKAIEAYMRKLVSREAPFDAFMAGDDTALTASQINGAWQFANHGCTTCHNGATFSDQTFHKLGVPQTGLNVPGTDDGRFANQPAEIAAANIFSINGDFSDDKATGKLAAIPVTVPDAWKATFRTPSLRGVADSAPYMHSGQLKTLSEVIDFYAAGGGVGNGEIAAFTISADEKADLIAFLGTLTGKAVPNALLTDTSTP